MDWNGVATSKAWHEMKLSKTNQKKNISVFPLIPSYLNFRLRNNVDFKTNSQSFHMLIGNNLN